MPDLRDLELTAINGSAVATGDVFTLVDVSDTTMSASGTNKKILTSELKELMYLSGMPRTARQSSQITNSSNTTPTSITGLSFPLTSGRRYHFRFLVTFQTAATTTGIGFVFTAPTMTAAAWSARMQQAGGGTDSFYELGAQALTTVIVNTAVFAANTDYVATIEGWCQPSADGTLQLQARSEINSSQITVQNTGLGLLIDAGA